MTRLPRCVFLLVYPLVHPLMHPLSPSCQLTMSTSLLTSSLYGSLIHPPTHLEPTLPSLLAIILRQHCYGHISMELPRSCAERLGCPNRSCHLENVLRQYSHRSKCMETSRRDYRRFSRGSSNLCDDTVPGKPLLTFRLTCSSGESSLSCIFVSRHLHTLSNTPLVKTSSRWRRHILVSIKGTCGVLTRRYDSPSDTPPPTLEHTF